MTKNDGKRDFFICYNDYSFHPCLAVIIGDCVELNDLCGVYNNYKALNPCRVCAVSPSSSSGESSSRRRPMEAARLASDAAIEIMEKLGTTGACEVGSYIDDGIVEEGDEEDDGDEDFDDDEGDKKRKRKSSPVADESRVLRASTMSTSSTPLSPAEQCRLLSMNASISV